MYIYSYVKITPDVSAVVSRVGCSHLVTTDIVHRTALRFVCHAYTAYNIL